MRILELTSCPACGGEEFERFWLDDAPLRRCLACSTVSALRMGDPAEIYVEGYMFGQNGSFGPGDVRDPGYQEYLMRVADRRVAMIEAATGLVAGSLLDVGCGTGEVLAAARNRGWRTQGVEPEHSAAAMARERGLTVAESSLGDSGLPEGSYDVVSAFHVLEHIADSRSFLGMLARWARPGGYVTIEVPNWRSVQRRRLRSDWSGLRPEEHVVHFTPETLASTMRASGLEPVYLRSPAYVGPPQTLDFALGDLVRHGRYRRVLERLTVPGEYKGEPARFPNRAGWAVLRATEAVYDRAGVGAVVFCVAARR